MREYTPKQKRDLAEGKERVVRILTKILLSSGEGLYEYETSRFIAARIYDVLEAQSDDQLKFLRLMEEKGVETRAANDFCFCSLDYAVFLAGVEEKLEIEIDESEVPPLRDEKRVTLTGLMKLIYDKKYGVAAAASS